MDFDAAWKVSNSVPDDQHHGDCSVNHGMLCDCEVLLTHPKHRADYGEHEYIPSWETVGRWVEGEWVMHYKNEEATTNE